MKAVRIETFGDASVLQYVDVPKPTAGAGELLVRVYAAGVNPVDWKFRAGYNPRLPLPITLGGDVSGVVEAVGTGVTEFAVGDAVYDNAPLTRDGAYAEYIVVPVAGVARKPQSLTHVEAAGVPIAALTAWQTLFEAAKLDAGQTILIHAAAGGVGHFAVQFARWKGARVIATASAQHADFVRSLGADQVIDYTATPFEDVVKDVDVVFDAIGGQTQQRSWQTLKHGGLLVSIVGGGPGAEEAQTRGYRFIAHGAHPSTADLTEIGRLLDAGQVKVAIERVLPLADAADAHRLSEAGHVRGKIVLQVVREA